VHSRTRKFEYVGPRRRINGKRIQELSANEFDRATNVAQGKKTRNGTSAVSLLVYRIDCNAKAPLRASFPEAAKCTPVRSRADPDPSIKLIRLFDVDLIKKGDIATGRRRASS